MMISATGSASVVAGAGFAADALPEAAMRAATAATEIVVPRRDMRSAALIRGRLGGPSPQVKRRSSPFQSQSAESNQFYRGSLGGDALSHIGKAEFLQFAVERGAADAELPRNHGHPPFIALERQP